MAELILVHGAFADAHAFDVVRPLLVARGHAVTTPDLPGHGSEDAAAASIALDTYVDAVARAVTARPEPVVLVGHSMAGMVIAQVAELHPERVRHAAFVAAYLPTDGQSLEQLAQGDGESLVGQSMVFAPDWTTVTIRPDRVVEALAADLPPAIQDLVQGGQRPEPLAPFRGTAQLSNERFGSVDRSYLHTARDRAVTPELQRRMVAAWPGTRTATLDTGHLPFLADPEGFVHELLGLARIG